MRAHSTPLSPHFLWQGPQCLVSSALSPGAGALMCKPRVCCAHWISCQMEGLLVCALWCPPVAVGSGYRRRGWGCVTVSCTLAREPGWTPGPRPWLCMFRGNVNNGTPSSWGLVVRFAPGEFSWLLGFLGLSQVFGWLPGVSR